MKSEVIKARGAIQIPHKVSLIQQQLWNVLLANAYPHLDQEEIHVMKMTDVLEYWAYETKNYDLFKEAIRVLNETRIEFNFINGGWGTFTLLAEGVLQDGFFKYAYTPSLREKLRNPGIYAKISLLIQQRFSSRHALALYELCIDYLGMEQTPLLEIETFREYMGIEEHEYKEWRDLNRWVIQTSIRDINKQSDLTITVKPQKTGRKITHLKFWIEKKTGFQLEMPLFAKISVQKLSETKDYTQHPLYKKLCAYPRFTTQEAIQILQAWSETEVYKACKYADGYLEPIKSYPAFLKKCLELGWYRQNDFPWSKAWWDTLDQNKRSTLYMKDFKEKHPTLDSASPEFQSWLIELWQQHLIQTEFAF